MPPPEQDTRNRELRGILHADVVGYSGIMAESEEEAIRVVAAIREVFAEFVPQRNGTFEVQAGDSFLALFPTAVGAVQAAVDIQIRLADAPTSFGRPLRIRIGVHMGDVVTHTGGGKSSNDINLAAHIQANARPGGVDVSEDVYRQARNKLADLRFVDLGLKEFKNIGEARRVYRLQLGEQGVERHPRSSAWRDRVRKQLSRRDVLTGLLVGGAGGVAYLVANVVSPRRKTTTTGLPAPTWPLAIGVMEIVPQGEVPGWMCNLTHQGLNALLSKFDKLEVFSKDVIDWKKEKTGQKSYDIAKELGVRKMINGTLLHSAGRVTLQVRVVDTETGLQQAACEASGTEDQLVAIQNDVGAKLVQALKMPVTKAEVDRLLAARTDVDLDVNRRFAEAFGGGDEPADDGDPSPTQPGARWLPWPGDAHATEGAEDAAIKRLLERYRAALETKSLEQLTTIYLTLTDGTREALGRYFDSASDLHVEFTDIAVFFEGEEALATFTRRDRFKDTQTGRDVNLELRLSTVMARHAGEWKIKALRKPS